MVLFSGSHMLAHMDHPDSSHLSFHHPNPSFLFTSSFPYPPSFLELFSLWPGIFSPTSPCSLSLSLTSSFSPCCLFILVYSTHPSGLLTHTLSADWTSYCLATQQSILRKRENSSQLKVTENKNDWEMTHVWKVETSGKEEWCEIKEFQSKKKK